MNKNTFTHDGGSHRRQRVLLVADGLRRIGEFESAEMLTAYAERIKADQSAKGKIDFNGMWNAMSDRSDAPLPARAAQVAQGEAVAKVRHFDYRGIARNDFSQEAQMLDGAPVLPDGTLLYTAPPAQPVERVPEVVGEVMAELGRAIAKFPTWPTDPLHAIGVVNEEVGELNKAVLQQVYEPHKNPSGAVRSEAVQAAAMALRFIASIDRYTFTGSQQHDQPALTAARQANR